MRHRCRANRAAQFRKGLHALLWTSLITAFGVTLHAAEHAQWPQFRGPGGNAIAGAQTIPLEFGPDRNLLWKTTLPIGHSSPCIWGDRIFVTGHVDTTLKMLCLRRSDGKILWELERKIAAIPRYLHVAGDPANPTPATDGERVYFLFDDHGVIATDFDGAVVWEKTFPSTANKYSYGASPIVDAGRLYLNRDGGLESALICLDARTGKSIWTAERPGTIGSFCTPYAMVDGSDRRILAGGSSRLQAYDAGTGAAVWTVDGLPAFVCPSAVAANGMIYFGGWTTAHVGGQSRVESAFEEGVLTAREKEDPRAFFERFDLNKDGRLAQSEFPEGRARDAFNWADKNASGFVEMEEWAPLYSNNVARSGRNVLLAIAAGGRNDITDTHVKWEVTKGLPYVSSPLAYRGRLYLVKAGGFISSLDATTGHPHYESARLGVTGEYYSTPVAVGDHIVLCAQRGTVFVLGTGDQLEIKARNDLNEPICATPAIVDNTIYVRSDQRLWAFKDSASVARVTSAPLAKPQQ